MLNMIGLIQGIELCRSEGVDPATAVAISNAVLAIMPPVNQMMLEAIEARTLRRPSSHDRYLGSNRQTCRRHRLAKPDGADRLRHADGDVRPRPRRPVSAASTSQPSPSCFGRLTPRAREPYRLSAQLMAVSEFDGAVIFLHRIGDEREDTGVVIVGAGHAGGTAAALLRQYGYAGTDHPGRRGADPALPAPAALQGLAQGRGRRRGADAQAGELLRRRGIELILRRQGRPSIARRRPAPSRLAERHGPWPTTS